MDTLLDVFDRIYIINLESRGDRRSEMTEQLGKIGLKIEPGKVEFFPAVRPGDAGGFPSIGARGCFMSHLGILRKAREENVGRMLILEDDLDFTPWFAAHQGEVLAKLMTMAWDGAYLGHVEDVPDSGEPGWELIASDRRMQTTHCIGSTRRWIEATVPFLETLLSRPAGDPAGGPMHVDGAYSWFRKENPEFATVMAVPNCGVQRSSRSDIADVQWFDKTPLISTLAQTARVLKRKIKGR